MRLTHLALEEFRSYRHLSIDVPEAGLRLFGQNASGKTSLLEAIYLLATTRSPRASLEREMINWSSNDEFGLAPYARVAGTVAGSSVEHEIEVVLQADSADSSTTRKRIKLDGRPRRAVDVIGSLKVVLFEPEDLNLVLGSPSARRRYLDVTLSQLDVNYVRALSRFGRLLEHRNSLLKDFAGRRQSGESGEELAYWDGELSRFAVYIVTSRMRYLQGTRQLAASTFAELSGGEARLDVEYAPSFALHDGQRQKIIAASPQDAQDLVARAFEEALSQARKEELRRGVTLVGPHRDDVTLSIQGRPLAAYGSRGQQRLGVVALKLAELRQVMNIAGERPVLLLDDVLSELDPGNRERLLTGLATAECQTIVTATDRHSLEHDSLADLPLLQVEHGSLHPIG